MKDTGKVIQCELSNEDNSEEDSELAHAINELLQKQGEVKLLTEQINSVISGLNF